jgi:2-desacetyl-2-hydroxyethyl bacteriochlorophyllide A dehydrogenase
MKAAVFYGKNDIRIENTQARSPKDNEVMIQVKACGVCGTDMHIYSGAQGATECNPPVILGHEFSGVVCEVGENVTRVKVGDHVTVDPSIMCETCDSCKTGSPHFCEEYIATGVNLDGGFAEYCTVLEKQVFKLKDSVPFEEGAMCEPLGCCLHGIDLAGIQTGDTVMIIGGGTIGMIMLQLAKISGAASVVLLEPVEEKRQLGIKLGADLAIDPLSEEVESILAKSDIHKINVTIECVGRKETMMDAVRYVGKGGTVMMFGLTEPDCEIPLKPFEIFKKEITIKASYVNPYTHGRAANILGSGKLRLKELISDVIPLDNINQAFEIKGHKGKIIIKP